nr:hypothetical protein [Vibrio alginolyticus]
MDLPYLNFTIILLIHLNKLRSFLYQQSSNLDSFFLGSPYILFTYELLVIPKVFICIH